MDPVVKHSQVRSDWAEFGTESECDLGVISSRAAHSLFVHESITHDEVGFLLFGYFT